jgi:hypothetical protein
MPHYEPDEWNDNGSIQHENNCYDYALDQKSGNFSQPGESQGYDLGYPIDCSKVIDGARRDGLIFLGDDEQAYGANCSETEDRRCWKVALIVSDLDYHWCRQDDDGSWSHKPGQGEVTNLDEFGAAIDNPRECAWSRVYSDFCGYFCVCPDTRTIEKAERGAAGAAGLVGPQESAVVMAVSANTSSQISRPDADGAGPITVHAMIFSGRRDPSWHLTADEAALIQKALQGLRPGKAFPGARLGYQGFRIENSGSLGNFPREVRVWHGAIAVIGEKGDRKVLRDTQGIEQSLLKMASTQPFANLLRTVIDRSSLGPGSHGDDESGD